MKKTSELFTRIQQLVEQDCRKQVVELPGYLKSLRPYHLKRIDGIMLEEYGIKVRTFVENFGNVTFTVDYETIENKFFERKLIG